MKIAVARLPEVAPGGLKEVRAGEEPVVLGNYQGRIYAFQKRCGHMNAGLSRGTLAGYIVTCPMHHARFDIRTGEVLGSTVPPNLGAELPPARMQEYFGFIADLMADIDILPLKTYPVEIAGDEILVEV